MSQSFDTYLNDINFEKYYKKLCKKIGNKKVILYGAGTFFKHVLENYDFSSLNIIGISDKKYLESDEGTEDLGYKVIYKDNIKNYSPDYILVTPQNYLSVLEGLWEYDLKGSKIKALPLFKKPLLMVIRNIWFE